MRFTRFVRRIILLAALPLLLLTIPAIASASAATTSTAAGATAGSGWIRLAHFSPNTPAVDVYLYSFGGASAQIVLHHVAYGDASPYEQVPTGDYTVAMRAAGASAKSHWCPGERRDGVKIWRGCGLAAGWGCWRFVAGAGGHVRSCGLAGRVRVEDAVVRPSADVVALWRA
jgi:Domain of unknown function (DUF4397)